MKVLLVDIGVFQPYILDNIKNLKLFGNNDITVITEPQFFKFFDGLSVELIDQHNLNEKVYKQKSRLDAHFWGGFWQHCSRRFFLINEYMKQYNAKNCVHLENDVISYVNFSELFKDIDQTKLWLAIDSSTRCIPSILFIPDQTFSQKIVDNYDYAKNDMINLGNIYYNTDFCESFPIINEGFEHLSKNFNGYIYDAAAIGQYLGGIDPRHEGGNKPGLVSPDCVVKYNNYKFYWKQINGLYVPHLEDIPIVNLHIHCKRLHDFIASNPQETTIIKK
jgi:hypothetical protein